MRWVGLVALLALGGCGSGDDGECAPRGGLYRMSFVEARNGTCGPLPDTVINANAADDPSCMGDAVNSADMCVVQLDQVCQTSDGGSVANRGQVTWDAGGNRGTGTVYFESRSRTGGVQCASTYQVTFARL